MKILAVIPARFGSTRFPGKPLVDMGGLTMIQRVYQQVTKAKHIHQIVVATDDERIEQQVLSFGGRCLMTDTKHSSGTDRCYEALSNQTEQFDYVINIQGDEPFIDPIQIDTLAQQLNGQNQLVTLVKKLNSLEQIHSPHIVKVVFTNQHQALYFSRSPIPYNRPYDDAQLCQVV